MKTIKIALILMAGLLALTACGAQEKIIPVTVSYKVGPDVISILGERYNLPIQTTTTSTTLTLDDHEVQIQGDFNEFWPELEAIPNRPAAELLRVGWTWWMDVITSSGHCFILGFDTIVNETYEAESCFNNVTSMEVIYTAEMEHCQVYEGGFSCVDNNVSMTLNSRTLNFTIADTVSEYDRQMIVDVLVFKGIDPDILLPTVILANANYAIPLP